MSCSKMQTDARVMNADKLRQYFTLCKFYSIHRQTSKPFSMLPFPSYTGKGNMRTGKLNVLRCKKNVLQNSFLNSAIKFYNELPANLRKEDNSYTKFKKQLFAHLFEKQSYEPGIRVRNTWRGFKIS